MSISDALGIVQHCAEKIGEAMELISEDLESRLHNVAEQLDQAADRLYAVNDGRSVSLDREAVMITEAMQKIRVMAGLCQEARQSLVAALEKGESWSNTVQQ